MQKNFYLYLFIWTRPYDLDFLSVNDIFFSVKIIQHGELTLSPGPEEHSDEQYSRPRYSLRPLMGGFIVDSPSHWKYDPGSTWIRRAWCFILLLLTLPRDAHPSCIRNDKSRDSIPLSSLGGRGPEDCYGYQSWRGGQSWKQNKRRKQKKTQDSRMARKPRKQQQLGTLDHSFENADFRWAFEILTLNISIHSQIPE